MESGQGHAVSMLRELLLVSGRQMTDCTRRTVGSGQWEAESHLMLSWRTDCPVSARYEN